MDIDGAEDAMICREAAEYWNGLGMREIVNKEVAMIRSEVRAGAWERGLRTTAPVRYNGTRTAPVQ